MFPVYAIVDTLLVSSLGLQTLDCATAMLDAGIRLLQIRHKGNWTEELFQQSSRLSEYCQSCGAQLVINDRADVAALLGVGIHVGQDDLTATEARSVAGPEAFLGVSTHNEQQLRQALTQPVNYVALGPIYGTQSKQNPDPIVGVAELQRLRSIVDKPLVAIGGISRTRAVEVWRAGADSVAVIGDLYPAGADLNSIRERAAEWVKLSSNERRR
ncbi:MAG TPA: thiamine phosphate synthase [Bryobacteraceae bacterium]|nr:thiamine phosphate synthase [Bryobacteraceae bacterium]